ncbi:MAG: hypothetical protein PHT97_14085, partial [Methanoculleus sp.]|uniref:hypothetical protein n=1 Tax=Methanoculleus sp. TaxID=90427 RepID=UPI002616AFEA
ESGNRSVSHTWKCIRNEEKPFSLLGLFSAQYRGFFTYVTAIETGQVPGTMESQLPCLERERIEEEIHRISQQGERPEENWKRLFLLS